MLDLDHPNWLPFNDPVNQLVHTEDGTAVASVMIGGRLVIDNRRVVTVDLGRLRDRVEAARERLAAANADHRRLYEALEPIVGSYCPGLARTPYHVHRYGARLDLIERRRDVGFRYSVLAIGSDNQNSKSHIPYRVRDDSRY